MELVLGIRYILHCSGRCSIDLFLKQNSWYELIKNIEHKAIELLLFRI